MYEHVLAGRLEGDDDGVAEYRVICVEIKSWLLAQHDRMVETVYNLLVDNLFQQTEIHHHAAFWTVGVLFGIADDSHKKLVTVSVEMAALSIVVV